MKASVAFLKRISAAVMNLQIQSPITRTEHIDKWLLSLLTGFALFFVLFIYKAYNIQEGSSYSGHSLLFRSLTFGFITSLTFFINEFYLSGLFLLSNVKRKLYWIAWEIFMGANMTFLLFNYFWNWTELYWNGYFLLLFEYTCVVTFPVLFVHILLKKSKKTPAGASKLHFLSENGKHRISLKPENLLYIRSGDNYVEVFYLSDNKVKCELLRNTLKAIEAQYAESPYLSRCHRSFIINPAQINQTISTNRQMQLDLGHGINVPVSQKYQSNFDMNKPLVHSPHL